jgi:hypothetical protein
MPVNPVAARMMRRGVFALTAMLVAGSTALAGPLELPGPYGSAAGCKYLADGEFGDESLVTLTSEGFGTYATECEFLQALSARDGSRVVTMLCSHEGEVYRTIESMLVVKAAKGDAIDLFTASGDLSNTVTRCRPRNESGR